MFYRRLLTWLWAAAVVGIFGWYLLHPADFTAENFQRILTGWGPFAFPGFVAVSMLRGPLLVPSTPVVLAGGASFCPVVAGRVSAARIAGATTAGCGAFRAPGNVTLRPPRAAQADGSAGAMT